MFAVWHIIVEPCFIPSEDKCKRAVIFLMVAIQKASADGQTVTFVLFNELFGGTHLAHMLRKQSWLDDFIGRTMTELQMICDFISSNPLAFQSYGMDFFSIPFCI
jgi:hypothetical protein